jgi:outer membrane protein assembly factor BamE (lipoprotein component of BamABCDE complex)
MSKKLVLIVLAGIFLGCSTPTVGRQFDTNAVNHIEVGKTTKNEVISLLGTPTSDKTLSNGISIFNYTYGISPPLKIDASVSTLEVQFYNGVVINKGQRLVDY